MYEVLALFDLYVDGCRSDVQLIGQDEEEAYKTLPEQWLEPQPVPDRSRCELKLRGMERVLVGTPSVLPHPWDETPDGVAERIAEQFYFVSEHDSEALCRKIKEQIEWEREVARHYLMQMGRWVNEAREKGVLK